MKIFLFFFILNLLAIPRIFGENICENVTFDECDLDEGAPTDTLFTLDSVMCQEICQSFSNCNFFRFDRTASDDNCQLFEANYRDSCNIVAAPIDRDINECLSNTENTCDKMIEETCQYSGKEIYSSTPGTITDATDCGDVCDDFEDLGCSYWKFDKANETCTLFDSDDRSCNILSGPEEPNIESCEGEWFCINIITATESTDTLSTGYLQVFVNNLPQFQEKWFDFGETVIDSCFPSLDTISVKNTNYDGWLGEIAVRKNGLVLKISCIDCSGSEFDSQICVDGDGDGQSHAPTQCLNGNLCTLKI